MVIKSLRAGHLNSKGLTFQKLQNILTYSIDLLFISGVRANLSQRHELPTISDFRLIQGQRICVYINNSLTVKTHLSTSSDENLSDFITLKIGGIKFLYIYNHSPYWSAEKMGVLINKENPDLIFGDLNFQMPYVGDNQKPEVKAEATLCYLQSRGFKNNYQEPTYISESGAKFQLDFVFSRSRVSDLSIKFCVEGTNHAFISFVAELQRNPASRVLAYPDEKLKAHEIHYQYGDYIVNFKLNEDKEGFVKGLQHAFKSESRGFYTEMTPNFSNFRRYAEAKSCLCSSEAWAKNLEQTYVYGNPDLNRQYDLIFDNLGSELSQTLFPCFSLKEVRRAIGNLSIRKKAPGPDGTLPIHYSYFLEQTTEVLNQAVIDSDFPDDTIIMPIFKKGDRKDPESYRKITLQNGLNNIFDELIRMRMIKEGAEAKFGNFQYGLSPGQCSEDLNSYVSLGIDKSAKAAGKVLMFYDITQAFDSVDRIVLIKKLRGLQVSDYLVYLVWISLRDHQTRIIGEHWSIMTRIGLKKGSPLSPLLFNLYISRLGQELSRFDGIQICMYADDLLVIADNIKQAKRIDKKVRKHLVNDLALRINYNSAKSNAVLAGPTPTLRSLEEEQVARPDLDDEDTLTVQGFSDYLEELSEWKKMMDDKSEMIGSLHLTHSYKYLVNAIGLSGKGYYTRKLDLTDKLKTFKSTLGVLKNYLLEGNMDDKNQR